MKNLALLSAAFIGVCSSNYLMSMEMEIGRFTVKYVPAYFKRTGSYGLCEEVPANFEVEAAHPPKAILNIELMRKHLNTAMSSDKSIKCHICTKQDPQTEIYKTTASIRITPIPTFDDEKKFLVEIKQKN